MSRTKQEKNKALVLEAFDTLFNKRDYVAAARYWSPPNILLAKAVPALPWKQPVNSLTICGHSVGGALATLLALDLAANAAAPFNEPTVYTYASPRTGDATFVSTYNHVVPNTFRIANRLDLVPKLPLPPLYDHVLGLFELNPVNFGIPPKVLVKETDTCAI
jgi:hypothetical protein